MFYSLTPNKPQRLKAEEQNITINRKPHMKITEIEHHASHQLNKGPLSGKGKKKRDYSLSLHVNGQAGLVSVKVIDNKSKETISEPSSQELREIHDQIYDMAGRLLDKKVLK